MRKRKKLRVALFFGGTSPERAVSLRTGLMVAQNLDVKKYEIIPIEISKKGKWLISSSMIDEISALIPVTKPVSTKEVAPIETRSKGKIDVALLALHGPGGEDGTIQGMLELLGIPYTCSGVMASALAMDKARTKRLVASVGVPVLPDVVLRRSELKNTSRKLLSKIRCPVVIKPNRMGSSLGITIARKKSQFQKAFVEAFKYDSEVLVEPYVDGRELTVPVLGNLHPRTLPIIEIVPWKKSFFYDYAAKYEDGGSKHLIPAPLSKAQERAINFYALSVHKALNCRGVTRSDFILNKNGKIYFLEVNTIPGMTQTSLVPQSAEVAGISFKKFLDILIAFAQEKD